jgi:2,3-bisphosphoglycerate-independent phosphoglycerate mutase
VVDVLVIPDGAAELPGEEATSLERAETPTLDEICSLGAVSARRTIPPGLPAGSEVGIPTLLGAKLAAAPGRGWIEAAAAGIPIPDGVAPRRTDLFRGGRRYVSPDPDRTAALLAPGARWLSGHRYLLLGREEPHAPAGLELRVWPPGPRLEPILDRSTVVVAASGGALGCARLLGARTVVPHRAGCAAKAETALAELPRARRLVVHVAAPDEAAHERDRSAKVAALEAIDRDLLAPLWAAVRERGGSIAVCPDHGTDPRTGRHLDEPVPCARWQPGIEPSGPARLHERLLLGEAVAA